MADVSYAKNEESRNPIMDVLVMLLNDQLGTNYQYEKINKTREETA